MLGPGARDPGPQVIAGTRKGVSAGRGGVSRHGAPSHACWGSGPVGLQGLGGAAQGLGSRNAPPGCPEQGPGNHSGGPDGACGPLSSRALPPAPTRAAEGGATPAVFFRRRRRAPARMHRGQHDRRPKRGRPAQEPRRVRATRPSRSQDPATPPEGPGGPKPSLPCRPQSPAASAPRAFAINSSPAPLRPAPPRALTCAGPGWAHDRLQLRAASTRDDQGQGGLVRSGPCAWNSAGLRAAPQTSTDRAGGGGAGSRSPAGEQRGAGMGPRASWVSGDRSAKGRPGPAT